MEQQSSVGMSTREDHPPRMRTVACHILALGIAAVGWEVWLDVYYSYGDPAKMLWLLAALLPLVKAGDVPVDVCLGSGPCALVLPTCGLLSALVLGPPYAVPAGVLSLAALLVLLCAEEGRQTLGKNICLFSLLLFLQLGVVSVLFPLVARTSLLPEVSHGLAGGLNWIGAAAGVNDGYLVLHNEHHAFRFAPSLRSLGLTWIGPFAISVTAWGWLTRGAGWAVSWLASTLFVLPAFRYVLLVVVYLEWDILDWFFSPGVSVAFVLLVTALTMAVESRRGSFPTRRRVLSLATTPRCSWRLLRGGVLLVLGCFFCGLAVWLPDPGQPKAGRVMIDEAHGGWEWTTEPFDTNWYGHASVYNYWCILDYVSAHYQTKRNVAAFSDTGLKDVDVLIVKTPSKAFAPSEVEALTRWVRAGGGLYLIGDHTNLFGMTTCLEPVATQFGMRFGYDATYDLETGQLQSYELPRWLRHPVAIHMPQQFLWGTSCSLLGGPGTEPVLLGNHVRSRFLDYGKKSYFGDTWFLPSDEHGLVLQCGAVHYGKGRVAAYTDSTVFSNFWVFLPGKVELFMGTLTWLNRTNSHRLVSWLSLAIGGLCLALGRAIIRPGRLSGGCLACALLLAVPAAFYFRDLCLRHWYALPPPRLPLRQVVLDREYSGVEMSDFRLNLEHDETNYHTFFVWIQRMGMIPRCMYSFQQATSTPGGSVILIKPRRALSRHHERRLDAFLRNGGRLLILEGPSHSPGLSNLLLERFGLYVDFHPVPGGQLRSPTRLDVPALALPSVCPIRGGQPVLQAGEAVVMARQEALGGEVWVCSLADEWSGAGLGTTVISPALQQRGRAEAQYFVLGAFMEEP